MPYEKVKIYTTKRLANILEKDAETFEFVKTDNFTPNKNALLSRVIVNYFPVYNTQQEKIYDKIKNLLQTNSTLNNTQVDTVGNLLASNFNIFSPFDKNEKYDTLVSLKPTKETSPILDFVDTYLLQDISLSEYFRNMFASYASLPQDKREEIVFAPIFKSINEAIKKHKNIFITTKTGYSKLEISPYAFARSKEELHLYLLFKNKNSCRTVKLAKITSVSILEKDSEFSSEDKQIFQKMQKLGAQFTVFPNSQNVVVKLTQKGVALFHKIYLHRPIPIKVDKNIFTFECSYIQAIQYFSRFGKEAHVLEPEYVKDAIFHFHKEAWESYEKNHN